MLRLRSLAGALAGVVVALTAAPTLAEAETQTAAVPSNGGFAVRAIINAGAKEIPQGVSFSLHRLNGRGEAELAAHASGGTAEFDLPQGQYLLTTVYGAALKQELVDADPRANHTVNLNAGEITLSVIPGVGRPALKEEIDWQILTFGRDSEGNRHVLHRVSGANPHLVLPAGWYFVAADYEGRRLTHTIEVGAGNRFDYTLVQQN
ncbi:MAG TPA: hypothetical protein VK035_10085 [Kiloniellales bacterium]|nr:hypothetical protein [Kiloniellales bacterium]